MFWNTFFFFYFLCSGYLLVLERGSRGPSTVTLMALA